MISKQQTNNKAPTFNEHDQKSIDVNIQGILSKIKTVSKNLIKFRNSNFLDVEL